MTAAAPVRASPHPRIARALLFSSGGDAASKLAVLATTVVAARALGSIDFAVFVGLSAIVILTSTVLDAGSTVVIAREVAADRISDRQATVEALAIRAKTLPVAAAVFVFGLFLLGSKTIPGGAIATFALAALAAALRLVPVALLQARLRFAAVGTAMSAGRWLTAAAAVPAFLVEPAHRLTLLGAATALGEAATIAVSAALVWTGPRSRSPGTRRIRLRASIPFAVNSLLGLAYNRFDVLIVAALTSATQYAAYAPASRIQDALYIIPTGLGAVTLPVVASAWRAGAGAGDVRRLLRKMIGIALAVGIPAAALACVFAPELLTTLLGGQYDDAVTSTRILVWFLPFGAVTAPLIAGLAAIGRARDTMIIFATTFAVAITMHVALVPPFGAVGGAVASLSRDPFGMVIAFVLAQRAGLFGQSYDTAEAIGHPVS